MEPATRSLEDQWFPALSGSKGETGACRMVDASSRPASSEPRCSTNGGKGMSMLSYLQYLEPPWLNGPPEPNPNDYSGTCPVCETEHYNGPGEGFETSVCSCGEAKCCEFCDRCSECGDRVCLQCSVKFNSKNQEILVCSGCHQAYLEDLEDEAVKPNAHVEPLMASILNAFIWKGVKP
jgi:hypothetical protein